MEVKKKAKMQERVLSRAWFNWYRYTTQSKATLRAVLWSCVGGEVVAEARQRGVGKSGAARAWWSSIVDVRTILATEMLVALKGWLADKSDETLEATSEKQMIKAGMVWKTIAAKALASSAVVARFKLAKSENSATGGVPGERIRGTMLRRVLYDSGKIVKEGWWKETHVVRRASAAGISGRPSVSKEEAAAEMMWREKEDGATFPHGAWMPSIAGYSVFHPHMTLEENPVLPDEMVRTSRTARALNLPHSYFPTLRYFFRWASYGCVGY